MIEILLVDDSEADVRLTLEALKEAKFGNAINVVYDGESAMERLRDPGKRRPDLILLDLNLPGMDGREVLAEIKKDPELAIIPVVVLTTSRAEEDILKTYRLHGNCFINKPVDLNQFIRVVQSIEEFWFTIVRLAPKA
ncbi:MAG TPA: response regulator [Polyangiaceae bacterium]|nr:response regulator [Polyangiaceae bacterium]